MSIFSQMRFQISDGHDIFVGMEHCVAIRADWSKVGNGVDVVLFANFCQWHNMMHMNETFA
ncbi:hypothetical protein BN2476_230387 [Paraburkholderia piptadeniae]|uniref:Uncharacterized protein n=1 Tax=Paraburkholderia piptadeniae TaxID=1701573 RepID=A0A1N7RY89_9BURK|nr:hypothetical protein BN2476_230387 [Paraburkholderia piptadeniae]